MKESDSEFLKAPASWHTAIRSLPGGFARPPDAYITEGIQVTGTEEALRFISIVGPEPKLGLDPGIYIVTSITVDDWLGGGLTREVLQRFGNAVIHELGILNNGQSALSVEVPRTIQSRFQLPEGTTMDLGNTIALNLVEGRSLNNFILFEIVEPTIAKAEKAFGIDNTLLDSPEA